MSAAVTVSRATSEDTSLPNASALIEVLARGDLRALSDEQRLHYYIDVCRSIGLNYKTRPFDYVDFKGKYMMYAKKDATDQLRKNHNVSVQITSREFVNGLYIVTARATDGKGRFDESIGVVPIAGKSGEDAANALMKAETKAKRRVTLSICGLGILDESELETMPGARVLNHDPNTGEVRPTLHAAPIRNEAEESAALRDKAFVALEKAQHDREQLAKWHTRVQQYKERGELTVDDTSSLLNAHSMALSILNESEA